MKKIPALALALLAGLALSSATYYPPPKWQAILEGGTPCSACKIYFYAAGTSTPKDTFTDYGGATANTNPVILDSRGEANIWLSGLYKVVLKTSTDVQIWTVDNYGDQSLPSASSPAGANLILNGSFELDANADLTPDNWTYTTFPTGVYTFLSTNSSSGSHSVKFISSGGGGGYITQSGYAEVSALSPVVLQFSLVSSTTDVRNVVKVNWYTSGLALISTTTPYDDATTNPTAWTAKIFALSPPAGTAYAKVVLTGCDSADPTNGYTIYDDVRLFPQSASTWQLAGGPVTWISATSFSVPTSTLFENGRRIWVSQVADALCYVTSANTVSGTTTVVVNTCEAYANPGTPASLANPIYSVSVSQTTPMSATLSPPIKEFSALRTINTPASPNSKITVTADALTAVNSLGQVKRLTSVNLTLDVTATGANGRDAAAAEANSAWYEIYVMAKQDGTTAGVLKLATISGATTAVTAGKLVNSAATFVTQGVAAGDLVMNDSAGTVTTVAAVDSETQLSLTADIFITAFPKNYRVFLNRAPTFPADYSYKVFVGYRYNDASGNFRNVTQIGATARFDEQVTDASTNPSTTWTTIILSIPPKAQSAFVTVAVGTNDANNATAQWRMKGSSSTLGHYMAGVNGTTQRQFNSFMAITDVYQRIEINFNIATASGITLYTDGYVLDL